MSSKTLVVQVSARRACGAVIESSIGSMHVTQIVDRPSVDEGLAALAGFGPFDRVVAALPAEDAAFRILSLPFHDRRRIGQAVGPALEEHVPLSLDEAAVAWDYTGPQHTGDVVAAMAPLSRIEELRGRIGAAVGDTRRLLWTPSVVLAAYRRALGETDSFVALDVGPDGAIIASVQDGALRALRMVAACEPDLMKRNVVWSVRTIAAPGDRVVIGGAWASRLGTGLESELSGLRLEPLPAASPVEGFGKRDWREVPGLVGLVLAAAGEHSAPSIDFTPAGTGLLGIRSVSDLPEEARPVLRWGTAALALLLTSLGLDYYELISQRNALAERAEQIYVTAMPSGSDGSGRKLKMEMRLKELTTRAAGLGSGASASPLQVMAMLSQSVGKNLDVRLSQLELVAPVVKISGNTESFEAVTKLQDSLRDSGNFDRADVKDVHVAVNGGGVDFLLELGISDNPGDGRERRGRSDADAVETRSDTAPVMRDAPAVAVPAPAAGQAADAASDEPVVEREKKDDGERDGEARRDRKRDGDRDDRDASAKAQKKMERAAEKALKADRKANRDAQRKAKAQAKARKKAERAARNTRSDKQRSDKSARSRDGAKPGADTRAPMAGEGA
ncbi:MAG TPA: hypothetical protein VEL28_21705 [Candidatus Binatia bacterium]|nr:hypothetical protein [Candidatus Binatia bacterium]